MVPISFESFQLLTWFLYLVVLVGILFVHQSILEGICVVCSVPWIKEKSLSIILNYKKERAFTLIVYWPLSQTSATHFFQLYLDYLLHRYERFLHKMEFIIDI